MAVLLAMPGLSTASFVLVDDFSGYAEGPLNATTTDGEWTRVGNTPAFVPMSDLVFLGAGGPALYDTVSVDGQHALATYANTTGADRVYRSLPSAIESTATFFYQFKPVSSAPYGAVNSNDPTLGSNALDLNFGLASSDMTSSFAYDDYGVQIRMISMGLVGQSDPLGEYFRLDVKNGNSLTTILETAKLPRNSWYSIWVVVNAEQQTFDLYFGAGAETATPTMIAQGQAFRNTSGPLTTVMAIANRSTNATGPNGNITNIYIDYDGVNLANPTAAAIPEPQTLFMGGIGSALILAMVMRRKHAAPSTAS